MHFNPRIERVMNEQMKEDIRKACEVMQKGGVILYPTDTIWGIGCDATNAEAVKRVYEIKKRADSKAMLVLVDNAVKVDFYVNEPPEVAFDLIECDNKFNDLDEIDQFLEEHKNSSNRKYITEIVINLLKI